MNESNAKAIAERMGWQHPEHSSNYHLLTMYYDTERGDTALELFEDEWHLTSAGTFDLIEKEFDLVEASDNRDFWFVSTQHQQGIGDHFCVEAPSLIQAVEQALCAIIEGVE